MTASGAHGAASSAGIGSLQALKEIKRAEEEVRRLKAAADKRAEETLQAAREDARGIVAEAKKNAQAHADTTVQKAIKLAESEAEGVVKAAEQEAAKLRNVSDATLDESASDVLSSFRDRVGGA